MFELIWVLLYIYIIYEFFEKKGEMALKGVLEEEEINGLKI